MAAIFGLQGRSYRLLDASGAELSANLASSLTGSTIQVVAKCVDSASAKAPIGGSVCRFVNLKMKGQVGTVLLENPAGRRLHDDVKQLEKLANKIFKISGRLSAKDLTSLEGKTVEFA